MTDHHAAAPTPVPLDGSSHRAHRAHRPLRPRRPLTATWDGGPDAERRTHSDVAPIGRRAAVEARLLDGDVTFAPGDKRPCREPAPENLSQHRARLGDRPDCSGDAGPRLIDAVAAARLSGRGGGHFPTAGKLRASLRAVQSGGSAVVVANAAEGEPASVKDAALLQSRPHLVIDGLVCVAELLGARQAVVWLHEDDHASRGALSTALAQRREHGSGEPTVRLMTGRSHYLTGESRSVVAGVSGRLPIPSFSRVPAAVSGVGGQPTLVQNVETLARLALIARSGAPHPTPGPLLSVLGSDRDEGQVLIARQGTDDLTVAEAMGHGWLGSTRPQAVLVGGYGGTWLRWSDAAELRLAQLDRRPAELGPGEASLGPGVLLALPHHACPVQETAAVVRYLAASSAGQCGPCTHGGPAVAHAWHRLAEGRGTRTCERKLLDLAAQIDRRGACALPDAIARITRTALLAFPDDVARHEAGAACPGLGAPLTLPLPLPRVQAGG